MEFDTNDLKFYPHETTNFEDFKKTQEFLSKELETRTKIAIMIMMENIIERNAGVIKRLPQGTKPEFDKFIKRHNV